MDDGEIDFDASQFQRVGPKVPTPAHSRDTQFVDLGMGEQAASPTGASGGPLTCFGALPFDTLIEILSYLSTPTLLSLVPQSCCALSRVISLVPHFSLSAEQVSAHLHYAHLHCAADVVPQAHELSAAVIADKTPAGIHPLAAEIRSVSGRSSASHQRIAAAAAASASRFGTLSTLRLDEFLQLTDALVSRYSAACLILCCMPVHA